MHEISYFSDMLYQTVYALYMVPRSQLNIFQYVMKIQWLVKYFLRHQWKLILTKRHDYHLENLSQVIDLQANQYRHISQLVLFLYICIFTTVLSLQINGHLCLTVTLRPAQLILLYNLTLSTVTSLTWPTVTYFMRESWDRLLIMAILDILSHDIMCTIDHVIRLLLR